MAAARAAQPRPGRVFAIPEGFVLLGDVGRAQGLRGEVAVNWHADARPESFGRLWIADGLHEPRPLPVESVRWHKGRPLLRFGDVADRDAAEALRGVALCVPRAALPEPAADEAYLADLMGAEVLLADGRRLGRLDHVEYPAGREVWSIHTDDGREVLFPAQPDFILELAVRDGTVRIDPPAGLLDVYLA